MDQTLAIRGPRFDLQLSHWDRRFMPMYSKRLLFFPAACDSRAQKQHIVDLLSHALKSTILQLPFLASSVVPFSKHQPWLYDIQGEGTAYLEIKDLSQHLNYAKLREAQFSSLLLDAEQLCPYPKAVYMGKHSVDACRLRANFINGGIILTMAVCHTICDGRGITEVLKVFASNFLKAQEGKATTQLIDTTSDHEDVYSFDRNVVLSGNGMSGTIEDHPCWSASPVKSHGSLPTMRTVSRGFHVTAESLRTLKQVAASPESPAISTHDVISALLWRSIMCARYRSGIFSSDSNVSISTAVDCRSRLNLPEPYFGNAIYGVQATITVSEFLSEITGSSPNIASGLGHAARRVRTEIKGATGAKFQDLLNFVEETDQHMLTRLSVMDDLATTGILLVSYFWFEMHELQFGELFDHNIAACRLPSQGLALGIPVILPRLQDGSCEFAINEREDVMDHLNRDELFQKFAQRRY